MADPLADGLYRFAEDSRQCAADIAEAAAILSYSLPPLSPRRLAWRRLRVRRTLWLLIADVEQFQIRYIGYPLLGLLRRIGMLPASP